MKLSVFSIAFALGAVSAAPTTTLEERAGSVQGFDISGYQRSVNFPGAYNSGARFVIIKATEGNTFIDPEFSSHYTGATNAGLIRGGYHFARPDVNSGGNQATFFLAHGGGWSADGRTLPGMLDIEYNPYGATCYGLSASAMVGWIQEFANTYHGRTGRYPMIYSTADWWSQCTGNSKAFASTCPLVLARYGSSHPGTIPGGWSFQTIWQNADSYAYGGDSDLFNGDLTQLKKLATG